MSKTDSNSLKWLYGVTLLGAVWVVFTAIGGGLTGGEGHWYSHWQHEAFRVLCHQDPARSFWVNGVPMAVCSRCFGIYSGFALFWLGVPLAGKLGSRDLFQGKWVLITAFGLNLVDVIANMLGFWQNSLVSRFLLGSTVGLAAVLFLSSEFKSINH